jgi:hypothetical protein
VTGKAGAGKTGCVVEFIEALQARHVPVLAFRLDRIESVSTTQKLGERLGLEESPALVLAEAAKGPSPPLSAAAESLAAPPGGPRGDQRWAVFLRNHARFIIACDFCTVVTAAFRVLYVFMVMEHASRRLIHLRPNRPLASSPTRSRSLGCQREDRRHAPVPSPLSDNGLASHSLR